MIYTVKYFSVFDLLLLEMNICFSALALEIEEGDEVPLGALEIG